MAADQRCVITTRIIGALHRDSPKLKVFMVSVSWSDGSEVMVYRSFQEFKKFHRQLKKRFPQLNRFKKNNRVIPKFKGKARRNSLPQKGSSRALLRMRFLESYCFKLLQCEVTVTQSTEVTQFFMPKDQDLQPDFTKNTVMIMLSDDLPEGSSGGGGAVEALQHGGNVTHPFITQTYRCVAAHETKDTKNRPFKAAVDEKVDVLIKDPAGWWLVENEEKRLAWFPAPFLEPCDEEDDDELMPMSALQHGGALYCAVRSYSTNRHDELPVTIGSVVEVLRKSDDGWWLTRFNGKAGYVPSMYLQPYNNPRAGLFSLQQKLHGSNLNLATQRDPRVSTAHRASISEGTLQPRVQFNPSQRLHKARSLDVLTETWIQAAPHGEEEDAAIQENNTRKMSTFSTLSNFSTFSSSSEDEELQSPPGLQGQPGLQSQPGLPAASTQPGNPDRRPSSSASSGSSGSVESGGSGSTLSAPKVPPRPKENEILARCTTMTRKAALAKKGRLQLRPEAQHSR
ncbi:NADPH oxidase organizer 1b [Genypterus blacodes]|uniref:NADPH oxidase organizer 1b n=1 Tax=Genypterus blacodes TaxID=154954 RepID=UPI003F773F80